MVRLMRVLGHHLRLAGYISVALYLTGCTTGGKDSAQPSPQPSTTKVTTNTVGVITGSVPTCYGPGPDLNLRKINMVEVRQQGHLLQTLRVSTDTTHHEYRLSVRSGDYRLKLSDLPHELAVSVMTGQTVRADFPAMTCL
jgi:hypothetical protein